MILKKNKKIRIVFFITAISMLSNCAVFANIKLPAIFSNGMVLQQQSKVPVWGWADVGEKVTVTGSWSAKNISVITDAQGNWKATLQTPKAGGPYLLTIKGNNSIILNDVLIGEIWLCSGQSNMVFALKGSEDAKEEIAAANFPFIRYYSVKRQYGPALFNDAPGSVWQTTSPQTALGFSAVAYFFAKKIHKDLKVPVGIIYAAWGGTPAEAWTPKKVLQNDDSLSLYIERWKNIQDNVGKDSTAYQPAMKQWQANRARGDTSEKKPVEPQTFYYYQRPWREPGVLFNGMIHPVIPFSIKGVLWYQGESNVAYADEYAHLFGSMIKSWRAHWQLETKKKNLPFYFVQIAPFNYSNLDAAARLRQAQNDVANTVSQTAMVATIDVGNMQDQHPIQKKEVGERLALLALNKEYGFKNLVFSGPSIKKIKTDKEKVAIHFDQKLFTKKKETPAGFEIGFKKDGSDSLLFVHAEAMIKENEVIVWNTGVQKPLIIRYAWLAIRQANLVNAQGLPMLPFTKKVE